MSTHLGAGLPRPRGSTGVRAGTLYHVEVIYNDVLDIIIK